MNVTKDKNDPEIQHILIALDNSDHSIAALKAAVELALRFNAEVIGLYIEDQLLCQLAELSIIKEVSFLTANRRRMEPASMAQNFRIQAKMAEVQFRRLMHRFSLKSEFKVLRGKISHEIMQNAGQSDLILMGKMGNTIDPSKHIGSTTFDVITSANHSTLVMQHYAEIGSPVILLFDGSLASRRGLQVAASYLERDEHLFIFLMDGEKEEQSLKEDINTWIEKKKIKVTYKFLKRDNLSHIIRFAERSSSGLMIVPFPCENITQDFIMRLLDEMDIPVMVIHPLDEQTCTEPEEELNQNGQG